MIPDRYWSWCTATIKINIELENESQTTCPIKQCIHIISEVLIIDEKKKKQKKGLGSYVLIFYIKDSLFISLIV